eukprot:2550885-Pyramimonas_sp.AAC.2
MLRPVDRNIAVKNPAGNRRRLMTSADLTTPEKQTAGMLGGGSGGQMRELDNLEIQLSSTARMSKGHVATDISSKPHR